MKYLFGLLFVLAGINHFARAANYVGMVPAFLPTPLALVYVSGVCEVVFGLMLLVPRLTRLAAWGLIALLLAVFPANLQMATHPALYPSIPPLALWVRLPLQAVLIWWAYLYTRKGLQFESAGTHDGRACKPR